MKHKDNDPDILSPLLDDEDELYKCTAAAVYKVLIENFSQVNTLQEDLATHPSFSQTWQSFWTDLSNFSAKNCFS